MTRKLASPYGDVACYCHISRMRLLVLVLCITQPTGTQGIQGIEGISHSRKGNKDRNHIICIPDKHLDLDLSNTLAIVTGETRWLMMLSVGHSGRADWGLLRCLPYDRGARLRIMHTIAYIYTHLYARYLPSFFFFLFTFWQRRLPLLLCISAKSTANGNLFSQKPQIAVWHHYLWKRG